MFTSVQQKEISGFLTYLWQADPFKAKWSILAKAYSLIRDSKGKDKAPLDSYLAINGPFIGIVAPAQYLEMLGWQIVSGDNGERLLRRDFDVDISSLDQDLLTSNVSVNDIIKYSYACGYIAADEANLIIPDNEPVMTMATSVQHTLPSKPASPMHTPYSVPVDKTIATSSDPTAAVNTAYAADAFEQNLSRSLRAEAGNDGAGSEDQDDELMAEASDDENADAASAADSEATGETSFSNDIASEIAATEVELDDSQAVAITQTALALQDGMPSWQDLGQSQEAAVSDDPLGWLDNAMALLNAPSGAPAQNPVDMLNNNFFTLAADDQYPFNGHFTPENTSIEFDPFMGDSFNAFDMSDYSSFMSYPDSS